MIRKLVFVVLGVLFFSLIITGQIFNTKAYQGNPIRVDRLESVNPERIEATLKPGEVHTAKITVKTGSSPIDKGDVMIVFDLTGSMGAELTQAKASGRAIMLEVADELPNTWFGVASFLDYPGTYYYPGYSSIYGASTDRPWVLNHNPWSETDDIVASINTLQLGNGKDIPESYSRMLYELKHSVNWRENTKKIAVVFGDAPAHDLNFNGSNYGGDPGRDGIAQSGDDLDFETVVRDLRNAGISVLAVNSGGSTAAPTFRGMSEGYGTAVGTKGAYYLLGHTDDLPGATVDLILSEASVIDRLSLRVTEGFKGWTDITPPFVEDVGANETEEFTVKMSPPEGTEPGLYPFAIQAVGDGNILGITHVEITVPGREDTTDLGYRPSDDGFKFANNGPFPSADWDMFTQFFGKEAVEFSNGDRIHAAENFFDYAYSKAGSGGNCEGFAASSAMSFLNLDQPNAGPYKMWHYDNLFEIEKNTDMEEAIAFYQAAQLGLEVQLSRRGLPKSPTKMYEYAKKLITEGMPAMVFIMWDDEFCAPWPSGETCTDPAAHSVMAYRYEDVDEETANLYIYDPNSPGKDNRRIEFNLIEDTWTFWLDQVWWSRDIPIKGDANSTDQGISFTPLEIHRHKGIPLWNEYRSFDRDELLVATHRVVDSNGKMQILFVDGAGRRLGFENGNYFEEIPDAFYVPIVEGDFTTGTFFIPKDKEVDISFAAPETGGGGIRLYEEGSMIDLSMQNIAGGSKATLDPGEGGESISVRVQEGSIDGDITVSRLLPDEDRTVTVKGGRLVERESLGVGIVISDDSGAEDNVILSGDVLVEKSLDVTVHGAGGSGYGVFGTANVDMDRDFFASADVSNWSSIPRLNLAVDWNQDGSVNEVKKLVNDAAPDDIYIHTDKVLLWGLDNAAQLTIGVRNQYGSYVQNGTHVKFVTDSGTISAPVKVTKGGLVYAGYIPDSYGTSTIQVEAGDTVKTIEIVTVKVHNVQLPMALQNSKGDPLPTATPSPTPTATPSPSPTPPTPSSRSWKTVGAGSASGGGISNNAKESGWPAVAVAPDGKVYVTWYDKSPGNEEIYVKRWNGSSWQALGGSASGGGISKNSGVSKAPAIAVAPDGTPYVTWRDWSSGKDQIYVRSWNGSAWVEVGAGSATGGGISKTNSGSEGWPTIAIGPGGKPYVAWEDDSNNGWDQIYVKRWTGSQWVEVGSNSASGKGISNNNEHSRRPNIAMGPDGKPYITFMDGSSGYVEIYVRRWNGSTWQEVGTGSATGRGISKTNGDSQTPWVSVGPDGKPFVAWTDSTSGDYEVYVRRWNGSTWAEVGSGSASGGGISKNSKDSLKSRMAMDPGGTPYIVWYDLTPGDAEIYVRYWNGSAWVEAGAGSASGGGISTNSGMSTVSGITVSPDGVPYVAWGDTSGGDFEIYIKKWSE